MVHGKRLDLGLGLYPAVILAIARKLANEHRDKLAQGIVPVGRRASSRAERVANLKAKTFQECAEAYIAARRGEWARPQAEGKPP